MHWMLMPIRRYADFRGRSRRCEYWMFTLFNVLLAIGFGIVQAAIGGGMVNAVERGALSGPNGGGGAMTAALGAVGMIGIVQLLVSLALLIPGLAVSVRRLHDIDRTGWWLVAPVALYAVVIAAAVFGVGMMLGATAPASAAGPHVAALAIAGIAGIALVVVGITLFVFACLDGTRGPNRYGADPKGNGQALDDVFR